VADGTSAPGGVGVAVGDGLAVAVWIRVGESLGSGVGVGDGFIVEVNDEVSPRIAAGLDGGETTKAAALVAPGARMGAAPVSGSGVRSVRWGVLAIFITAVALGTGGTAAGVFAPLGMPVVDADVISSSGMPASTSGGTSRRRMVSNVRRISGSRSSSR